MSYLSNPSQIFKTEVMEPVSRLLKGVYVFWLTQYILKSFPA